MNKLIIIAGPCVIESYTLIEDIAGNLKNLSNKLDFDFVFKASFDKANRSSISSFRGPGLEKGLEYLQKIKKNFNVKVTSDIHESYQAEAAGEVLDIIQIPAFLCRQTDLLISAAKTGRIVNVKKAQFLSAESMINVIDKIKSTGNNNIYLTERGTMLGLSQLVVDMTAMIKMKNFGYPVIFDATHSVQQPSIGGKTTGGNRIYAPTLGNASLSLGIDGIFMEVHPNPEKAKSDGPNMISLDKTEGVISNFIKYYNISKNKL